MCMLREVPVHASDEGLVCWLLTHSAPLVQRRYHRYVDPLARVCRCSPSSVPMNKTHVSVAYTLADSCKLCIYLQVCRRSDARSDVLHVFRPCMLKRVLHGAYEALLPVAHVLCWIIMHLTCNLYDTRSFASRFLLITCIRPTSFTHTREISQQNTKHCTSLSATGFTLLLSKADLMLAVQLCHTEFQHKTATLYKAQNQIPVLYAGQRQAAGTNIHRCCRCTLTGLNLWCMACKYRRLALNVSGGKPILTSL